MHDSPVFFTLGTIAAHACSTSDGFRQRNVRFFAELFSNWIEVGGLGSVFAMHNTQIARYLTALVHDGSARTVGRSRPPLYRLTRGGLFELLVFLTQRSYLENRAECYLTWYFLKGYTPQIQSLLRTAGNEFSRAHRLEMETLLDLRAFTERQIKFADMELGRLNERVESAHAIAQELGKRRKEESFERCIEYVSTHYPYELNSQMPLNKLLLSLPSSIGTWEIFEGTELRTTAIFQPIREEIQRYREQLRELLKRT